MTRTYLCPDCDGYRTTGGEQLDVDDFAPEYDCTGDCGGSGVITAEHGRDDLHPWTGEEGRALHCFRGCPRKDILVRFAEMRASKGNYKYPATWRRYYDELVQSVRFHKRQYPANPLRALILAEIEIDVEATFPKLSPETVKWFNKRDAA